MPGVMQGAKLATGAQLAMPSRDAKWLFSSLACLPGTLPGRSSCQRAGSPSWWMSLSDTYLALLWLSLVCNCSVLLTAS